jgi:hypothetical protein
VDAGHGGCRPFRLSTTDPAAVPVVLAGKTRTPTDTHVRAYQLQNSFGTRSMYIIRAVRAHGPCVYVRWRRTGVRSMRRLSANSSKKGTCSRGNIDPHCTWKIILSVDFHVDLISHTNTYSVYAFAWSVACFFR